jgi:hypothetical protein
MAFNATTLKEGLPSYARICSINSKTFKDIHLLVNDIKFYVLDTKHTLTYVRTVEHAVHL